MEDYLLIPEIYSKFLTEKGSIAINGVSLTINSLKDTERGCLISINIILNLEITNFSELEKGSEINFEIDLIARTLARLTRIEHRQGLQKRTKMTLKKVLKFLPLHR